jgi:hypothetical protein
VKKKGETMQAEIPKTLSFTDLDLSTPCDSGYEFEYIPDSTGNPSGVFITVVGAHSDKVKSWVRKSLNRMRERDMIMTKKGKLEVRLVEDDEQFTIENAACRVLAWRGISEDFNLKNAITLCTINPEIRDQIIKNSEELGNFIKSK